MILITKIFGDKLIVYKKYLDDSLVISYIQDEIEFKNYVDEINKIDKEIQFTYEFGVGDGKLLTNGKIMNTILSIYFNEKTFRRKTFVVVFFRDFSSRLFAYVLRNVEKH